MRRHLLAGFLLGGALTGCEAHGRPPFADASIDVAIDAPIPRNDPGMGPIEQPFDASFVTPAGTIETHFLFASAIWGDCDPASWELRFTATEDGAEPAITIQIQMPHYTGAEVSGIMPAAAFYHSAPPLVAHNTHSVTFEATRIDYPAGGAPRLTGRFADTDPAWTIDFPIDILGISSGCI